MKPLIFDYSIDRENESVTLLLSMSSIATLKVALLFETFFSSISKEISKNALDIHRIDIYKSVESKEQKYIEPFIAKDPSERFMINE